MNDAHAQAGASESAPGVTRKKRFGFWQCFWLTFLVVSLAYAWYCFYAPPNDIDWADNYVSAQQRAAGHEKPMILYFTGKWCVPCRIMKRQVWADKQVMAAVHDKFIPVEIDVDNPDNAKLLARYKIEGTPVTIITDPHGNALDWRSGGVTKSDFLAFLGSMSQLESRVQ